MQSFDSLRQYFLLKTNARRKAEFFSDDNTSQLSFAQSFCAAMLNTYWSELCLTHGAKLSIPYHPFLLQLTNKDDAILAKDIGVLIASFPVKEAIYLIGSVYTSMLPEPMRSNMGAYYTPPPIVNRLLDLSEFAGVDFKSCSVIDPSCGGGAFLASAAMRMVKFTTKSSTKSILDDITTRLRGIELDPFAAWISHVLLEASLLPLCVASKARIPQVVMVGDALSHDNIGHFDLVIGNPPYGRVKLNKQMRAYYKRSLYGHANLYTLFTDLALRLVNPGGVISYLTPTSFLGGQYYKSLRELLSNQTTPISFDFVSDRDGVFDGVLQETVLATYHISKSNKPASVSLIVPKGIGCVTIEPIGEVRVSNNIGPWVIPRVIYHSSYIQSLSKMPTRLSDYGYHVSTGQLVWNRYKPQLRIIRTNNEFPVIWAESVTSRGFSFTAKRRNHAPYIEIHNCPHLITHKECVLLHRTTSKEQGRRLLSAVIPQEFIDQTCGVVIENHLNIVYSNGDEEISSKTISTILNSKSVDQAFRCISGSVAVSAYELESLPLPTVNQVKIIESMIRRGDDSVDIDAAIASFYENKNK